MLAEHNSPGAFAVIGQIIPIVCIIREHLPCCLSAMNSFYSSLQGLIILRSQLFLRPLLPCNITCTYRLRRGGEVYP